MMFQTALTGESHTLIWHFVKLHLVVTIKKSNLDALERQVLCTFIGCTKTLSQTDWSIFDHIFNIFPSFFSRYDKEHLHLIDIHEWIKRNALQTFHWIDPSKYSKKYPKYHVRQCRGLISVTIYFDIFGTSLPWQPNPNCKFHFLK